MARAPARRHACTRDGLDLVEQRACRRGRVSLPPHDGATATCYGIAVRIFPSSSLIELTVAPPPSRAGSCLHTERHVALHLHRPLWGRAGLRGRVHQTRAGEPTLRVGGPRQGACQEVGPMTRRATIDVVKQQHQRTAVARRQVADRDAVGTYWSRVWQPVLDWSAGAAAAAPVIR
jgi:hypothetical protein